MQRVTASSRNCNRLRTPTSGEIVMKSLRILGAVALSVLAGAALAQGKT